MIEVQGLTKQYGPVTAIRDVSFNVYENGTVSAFKSGTTERIF